MGFMFDESLQEMIRNDYYNTSRKYKGYVIYQLKGNDPEFSKYIASNGKKVFFSPTIQHLQNQIDDGRL